MKQKKPKKKRSGWQILNSIILLLHIIFPVWLVPLMMISAISGKLFLIAVVTSLLLGVVYRQVKKRQNGKALLYLARVVAIGSCIAFYMPMIVLTNFSHTKLLYPLKRLDYSYGVFGENADYYLRLLPKTLPEKCEDYSYRTQGSMVAQDYHPSSYLKFYTDTGTLDAYTEHFEALDCTRLENDPENEEAMNHIHWFCGQMRLDDPCEGSFDNAVLYWFDSHYPKGALLCYDTGLVAILT